MDYILTANAIEKRYKQTKALSNLHMHIPKGAIYGFVGKNGAGKTTFIRLLCGLQEPDGGSFTLYDVPNDHKRIAQSRRRMGAVVETPSIYLDMTARENLKQQYRILGLPSCDGLEEILTLVGLADTGKKKAKHFSLGMRQRLGIAVALVGDPDFLVLDEPANGLDPQGIVEVRELILRLNREREITFLISSHILEELSKFATHYGFIDGGTILREMTAAELEAACRKCIRMEVSDPKKLATLLDDMGVAYDIMGVTDTHATAHATAHAVVDVYAQLNVTELTMALDKAGCKVYRMTERDEGLEGFYINLIGGNNGGEGHE